MNLDLAENTNKLILLVVAAVALLLTLNTYQKQIGKNLAVVLSIVTIVVVGYVAFNLMNKKPAANNNANNVNLVNNVAMNNVARNNATMNNVARNNAARNNAAMNNNVVEGFQSNANVLQKRKELAKAMHDHEHFQGNNEEEEEVVEEETNNVAVNNAQTNNPVDSGVLRCSDLLPADTNSTWAQVAPSGVGELCTKNLLNAGHHIGVNTQGCSLRNANRGLRSEPPNPQVQVSPWLQTTICPDLLRRPLE